MDSNTKLILFAHARSGSSNLYQILQLHPSLNVLEEPFNEGFTSWSPNNKNYRELIHDIPSLDAQLAEIFTAYNGVKVLEYQLPDELAVHMLQRQDCKVIFLRRRNLLQSVVSAMIAQQTQLWKKWDMTKPLEDYYRDLQPLNIATIQRHITELKQHLDFFENIVDARGGATAIKLVYEDLYFAPAAARDAQIAAIWAWLGLKPLDPAQLQYYLRPETAKINSAATYAYLPNAREIEQQCGNDLTGWLYEKLPALPKAGTAPEI
jgi:hypothetical protein